MLRSVQRALERIQRVMRVFSEVQKNHKSVLPLHFTIGYVTQNCIAPHEYDCLVYPRHIETIVKQVY